MNTLSGSVLFIYNNFYQGQESYGPTSSWEITWKSSIQAYFGRKVYFFHPDIYGPDSNEESDQSLLKLVSEISPKLIVMIYHNGAQWNRVFISTEAMQSLHSVTRIVGIWGDIHHPEQRVLLRKLEPFIHLNLCTASSAAVKRLGLGNKVRYIPVPILDMKVNSDCNCRSRVSFAGGMKDRRAQIINFLKRNGVGIHHGGGEGSKTLSRTDFLSLLGHDMSISFGGSRLESLTNARTFEILSQESLLLEEWGTETCKILKPFVEYVPWFNKNDLLKKIDYYQRNPEMARKIALNGSLKLKDFSNEILWDSVILAAVPDDLGNSVVGFKMNLQGIPFRYKLQALFFNSLAESTSLDKPFVVFFSIKSRISQLKLYSKFAKNKIRKILFS